MKSTKILVLVVVLAVLAVVSYRLNRTPEKAKEAPHPVVVVDEKAKSILEAANEATGKIKLVSYAANYHVDRGNIQMEGTVRMSPENFWAYQDVTKSTRGERDLGSFLTTTDGQRVYQLVRGQKEMVHGEFPDRSYLFQRGAELVMSEFGTDKPFDSELKATSRYEGRKPVGDTECDVVYVEYKSPGEHARWFFGPDHLPRRVERMSYMFPDLPEDQRMKKTLTLSELNTGPELTAADFRLTLPEGYTEYELKPPAPLLTAGTEAPDWELKTPEGKSVSLASLRGNVVLMDFWATWCGPCKMAMPGIQKVHEHFEGKPVTVLGVNCQDPDGDPAAYMSKKNYSYTLLLHGDRVAEAYNVMGLPTMYVIDPEGKVAHAVVGAGAEEELVGIIDRLLPPTARTASVD